MQQMTVENELKYGFKRTNTKKNVYQKPHAATIQFTQFAKLISISMHFWYET